MEWSEPRDLQDWFKRMFSVRSLTAVLIILLLAVFEFRFDWIERALGSYLSTTNRQRPETGVIWETAHHTEQAQDSLEEIIVDRETVQSSARSAVDLAGIVSLITDNQSVMIAPDHFLSLYMKLAPSLRARILAPMDLLYLKAEDQWDRTYLRKSGDRLSIYLIDQNNRVLHGADLPDSVLVQIERGAVVFEGSLEEWGAPADRILAADRFLYALGSLPDDTREDIMAQPEQILNAEGRLLRVGIPSRLQTTWVDIGFEIDDGARRRVVILPAREWALGQLVAVLENAPAQPEPMTPNPGEQIEP